jgi:hypothetical protein
VRRNRNLRRVSQPDDVRRLKHLEQENARLKKLVAERDLELEVMKEIAEKKMVCRSRYEWIRRMHVLRLAAAVIAGVTAAASLAAAREPLQPLYGLRLGEPIADQVVPCSAGNDGATPDERPCTEGPIRVRDGLVEARIRLPRAVFAEAGLLSVRGVRLAEGRVVEIELEGMAADLARLGRSLRQRKGPPQETETIERHSRVGGFTRPKVHTWRDATSTLFFDEVSQSDRPRLRAFVNAWAEKAAGR